MVIIKVEIHYRKQNHKSAVAARGVREVECEGVQRFGNGDVNMQDFHVPEGLLNGISSTRKALHEYPHITTERLSEHVPSKVTVNPHIKTFQMDIKLADLYLTN